MPDLSGFGKRFAASWHTALDGARGTGLPALLLLSIGLETAAAQAEDASAWAQGRGSAVRLLAGPSGAGVDRSAGVEIRLDPGWMTYWRNPGEAGVAPHFDWSASHNLVQVTVRWPAPKRFDESGSSTVGYAEDVTLPVAIQARDPAKPVELALTLDYGACRQLCVPGQARLALSLAPEGAASADIAAAEARVPKPSQVGDAGPVAITTVRRLSAEALLIQARANQPAELFVEAPDGWYLAPPERTPEGFHLSLDGAQKGVPTAGKDLLLTLTTPDGAIETSVTIPAP